MNDDHKRCPECDSLDTDRQNIETFNNIIETVRLCNTCPTQWTVHYGRPIIEDITRFDEPTAP